MIKHNENQHNFREATRDDIPEIVRLLADDHLGSKREDYRLPIPDYYYAGFEGVLSDPSNTIIILEKDHNIIGTMQLIMMHGISHRGARRMQIESVRVASELRGQGIGKQMIAWAIERAKEEHCRFVQLTSNKERPDAHRFYEQLGFAKNKEGFSLDLYSL